MAFITLIFTASGLLAFMGRFIIYCAQYEEWLKFWAYGAYVFAVLLAIAGIVEFFKSIARARRRARTAPRRRRRPR